MYSYRDKQVSSKYGDSKILHFTETEFGEEYIIYQGGQFKKYMFSSITGSGVEEVISFNEFFMWKARGLRFAMMISRCIMFEVMFGILISILAYLNFSLASFSSLVLMDWKWVVCGLLLFVRKNNSALEMVKLGFFAYFLLDLCNILLGLVGGGSIRYFILGVALLFVLAGGFKANLKFEYKLLYEKLKKEFS